MSLSDRAGSKSVVLMAWKESMSVGAAAAPPNRGEPATAEGARLDAMVARYHAWIDEHGAVLPRFDQVR